MSSKKEVTTTDGQSKPSSRCCKSCVITIMLVTLSGVLIGLGVHFLTPTGSAAAQTPMSFPLNNEGDEIDEGALALDETIKDNLEESSQINSEATTPSRGRDENGLGGYDAKSPWEVCLKMTGSDCCEFILSTSVDVDTCLVLPPDGMRLMNYDSSRVYVVTNFSNIVIEVPMIG
mmetsp:Transcript_22116/g.33546  ORF Transcript_22116/g.33546 Transcript_22116/m.33546 type:complete len:175 (+) Transcript_22116:84-608(+)|eukprot:CAMPEP_0194257824 /NCGR_PEP_ID=MMETSP0158-20130606/39973_1 /TAXON_ID=33649 /ORGANISM="Thalassionema nitzschioides, Strain L26-B" /LENGTH=174 /DNA_ID=CAMNT_0038997001 /DNA_START=33 /DNA_END=557 /DNA_ORIENTATION=+